jgi:hypothetical protein
MSRAGLENACPGTGSGSAGQDRFPLIQHSRDPIRQSFPESKSAGKQGSFGEFGPNCRKTTLKLTEMS